MQKSWLVVIALLIVATTSGAVGLDQPPAVRPAVAGSWRVVDREIARVAVAAEPLAVAHELGLAVTDSRLQVIVVATAGRAAEVADWLEAHGAREVAWRGELVQAFVPPELLAQLDQQDDVRWVRAPSYVAPPGPLPAAAAARPKLLAVTSEGVAAANADEWQADGFTGAGVKVGVIDVELGGYMDLLGSELPSTVTYQRFAGVLTDDAVHGTACAEIVHDLAPGAEMYLALVRTTFDVTRAIDWMASQDVDVVTASIGTVEGPGDGTGSEATAIAAYANGGQRLYMTSAGNERTSHWQGAARDTDGDGWLEFNDAGDELLAISPAAPANQQMKVALMWSDWTLPTQDLSLHMFAVGGGDPMEVDSADAAQTGFGGQRPVEVVRYTPAERTSLAVGVYVNNLMHVSRGCGRTSLHAYTSTGPYRTATRGRPQ